jgi:hypothetical protein
MRVNALQALKSGKLGSFLQLGFVPANCVRFVNTLATRALLAVSMATANRSKLTGSKPSQPAALSGNGIWVCFAISGCSLALVPAPGIASASRSSYGYN